MKTLLLAPLPAALTGLIILLAILPWGGPSWIDFTLMLLPIAAICFWSARRPTFMPALLVFSSGLMLDVLTHGPLGQWAGAALIAAAMGRMSRRARPGFGWFRATVHAALTITLCAAYAGLLTSVHAWQIVELKPLLSATGAAIVAYPLLAGVLSVIEGALPDAESGALFLGRD